MWRGVCEGLRWVGVGLTLYEEEYSREDNEMKQSSLTYREIGDRFADLMQGTNGKSDMRLLDSAFRQEIYSSMTLFPIAVELVVVSSPNRRPCMSKPGADDQSFGGLADRLGRGWQCARTVSRWNSRGSRRVPRWSPAQCQTQRPQFVDLRSIGPELHPGEARK